MQIPKTCEYKDCQLAPTTMVKDFVRVELSELRRVK
jgi:hypothetical protein